MRSHFLPGNRLFWLSVLLFLLLLQGSGPGLARPDDGAPGAAAPAATETVVVEYRYDAAGRLLEADYGDRGAIRYDYDADGNLLQRAAEAAGSRLFLPAVQRGR